LPEGGDTHDWQGILKHAEKERPKHGTERRTGTAGNSYATDDTGSHCQEFEPKGNFRISNSKTCHPQIAA